MKPYKDNPILNDQQDHKAQCTCGNFTPYGVFGVATAALQPFGSCTNCYPQMMLDNYNTTNNTAIQFMESFDISLVELREDFKKMTEEERNRLFNGIWEVKDEQ